MQSALLVVATIVMTMSSAVVISDLTDSETEDTHTVTAVVASSARPAPPEQIIYGPLNPIREMCLFHMSPIKVATTATED